MSAPREPMRAPARSSSSIHHQQRSSSTRSSVGRGGAFPTPPPQQLPAQGSESAGNSGGTAFTRKTTKYWVKQQDIPEVKRIIGRHLPLYQFNQDLEGDSQLCNSVYLDNASKELYNGRIDKTPQALAVRLRWYDTGEPSLVFVERKTHKDSWSGELSVKERFTLPESQVVAFMRGQLSVDAVAVAMLDRNKSQVEVTEMRALFNEVAAVVTTKKLVPAVRTQYMRAAWQSDSSASVRISLDTDLCMLSENPSRQRQSTLETGRWYRDPLVPLLSDEVVWFPHGVLEVKLALPDGEEPPEWVAELLDSSLCHEVHKFSKFLHGTATLMSSQVDAVPYWIDDASLVASIRAASPRPSRVSHVAASGGVSTNGGAIELQDFDNGQFQNPAANDSGLDWNGRRRGGLRAALLGQRRRATQQGWEGDHPLQPGRGDGPQLLDSQSQVEQGCFENIFCDHERCCWGGHQAETMHRQRPLRIEPKVFFANERTFLSWMHMSVMLGSIGGAMLGLANIGGSDIDATKVRWNNC